MPRRAEESWKDMVADMLEEYRERTTDEMVAQLGPSPDTEDIPNEREVELFWHTTMTPEQQAALWADPNMDEETFSRTVYPTRWAMLDQGGRVTEEQQAKWAAKLAAKRPAGSSVAPEPGADTLPTLPAVAPTAPMPAPQAPPGSPDDGYPPIP